MSLIDGEPNLTEPKIVPCLYVNGLVVDQSFDVVRIAGWSTMPKVDGETPERRIVIHFAIPNEIARGLIMQLRKLVAKGGH